MHQQAIAQHSDLLEQHGARAVWYLGLGNNEAQGLAVVLHLVPGKQDLTKYLRAAFLGYVISTCKGRKGTFTG